MRFLRKIERDWYIKKFAHCASAFLGVEEMKKNLSNPVFAAFFARMRNGRRIVLKKNASNSKTNFANCGKSEPRSADGFGTFANPKLIHNPLRIEGGKRIDLVVDGGQARLAVECDGDHWHGVDRYEDDEQRQRQLERCGWVFVYVREAAFYSNRVVALEGLWRALEERDIFARSSSAAAFPETGKTEEND